MRFCEIYSIWKFGPRTTAMEEALKHWQSDNGCDGPNMDKFDLTMQRIQKIQSSGVEINNPSIIGKKIFMQILSCVFSKKPDPGKTAKPDWSIVHLSVKPSQLCVPWLPSMSLTVLIMHVSFLQQLDLDQNNNLTFVHFHETVQFLKYNRPEQTGEVDTEFKYDNIKFHVKRFKQMQYPFVLSFRHRWYSLMTNVDIEAQAYRKKYMGEINWN